MECLSRCVGWMEFGEGVKGCLDSCWAPEWLSGLRHWIRTGGVYISVSDGDWLSLSPASAQKKKGDILQPCDTEYPSFVYEPSIKETNSLIKCGRCQKMFVTQAVPDSNLLMLVVQADCDCSRQYPAITMEPKECDRMKSQKVRRRPESCHAYHPQENAKECGDASQIYLSVSLFLTCLTASFTCLKASTLVFR
uniref:Voltage-dependent calcium channel alpha-2/delta subunit conserved region domain-containing protein n=1 Tax=Oncorhynchus tshawytscha TaxID=74940 RepID=A0A8C8GE83_ONCTS